MPGRIRPWVSLRFELQLEDERGRVLFIMLRGISPASFFCLSILAFYYFGGFFYGFGSGGGAVWKVLVLGLS